MDDFKLADGQSLADFLNGGVLFEAEVIRSSTEIREASKRGYKREWLDARLLLLSMIAKLFASKSGVPGATNADRSDRILLIGSFLQGVAVTETLVSEGQYIKAAAVLKQDYEILTRIRETKVGAAKVGQNPQVRHAPEGSQHFYGDLNKIAHPSNPHVIADLLHVHEVGDVVGPTYVPRYIPETANSLYELHVWLLLEIAREIVLLFFEMYDADDPSIRSALFEMAVVLDLVKQAGFRIEA